MIIKSAEFVTSVASKEKIIYDCPQVAFVGRSNVGKSSLINMLCNAKKLAKTSNTAGRTRLINYFKINQKFYFVDLPGYGFAKAQKSLVLNWQALIEPYIIDNSALKLICLLVDSRILPTEQDKQMFIYLSYFKLPFIVIATKCDKLSKMQLNINVLKIANELKIGTGNIIATSSQTLYNKTELLNAIEKYLSI